MICERCGKLEATTRQEYRESSFEPHWRNTITNRCDPCAQALREWVAIVKGVTIQIEEQLHGQT